jgi:cell division protein FtsA
VLTEEERELGVALVDIGGGTTDIAIFANDSIKHTHVLALGGQNLTNDIAFGLRTPIAAAERIKLKYGCALTDMVRHSSKSPPWAAVIPVASPARSWRRSASRAWKRSCVW